MNVEEAGEVNKDIRKFFCLCLPRRRKGVNLCITPEIEQRVINCSVVIEWLLVFTRRKNHFSKMAIFSDSQTLRKTYILLIFLKLNKILTLNIVIHPFYQENCNRCEIQLASWRSLFRNPRKNLLIFY